ncbi:hypothetical protein K1719_020335 [Acacia pycnantha]|nr:hypothetical protein K1719_020335 [Acacia pycnantha]
MDPSGNSTGGETPPSSQNQTQLHWPGQTHVTANNESHIINEPSLTLHNAGGRRAPPSRSRPLENEEPRQPPLGTIQESHIINEQIPPPNHAANGRGAQPSPSSQRQLDNREYFLKDIILQIQHLLQRINQEYHTIMKTSPSLYSAGQRTFLQDWTNKLLQQDLEDQLLQCQHALRVHQESHTMKKPSSSSEDRRGGVVTRSCANCNNTSTTQWRSDPTGQKNQTQLHWPGQTHITANNELHIMNEPSLTLHNAGGRRAPPSRSRPLEIEEPRQPPLGTNQESHIINEQIPPPHHAANGRGAQPSPSSQRQLTNREQGLKDKILQIQHLLQRINQEYHTIMKTSPSLYSAGQRKFLQDWTNKLLQQDLEDQLLQCQHALRVHQESHTMKKPSSSSEDRRGGVVTRSCANCNNTSTTQWRSDPTGQKSLCNACGCGIRLNREEKTRAASGFQSSNLSSAALRRHLEEARNSVQFAENVLLEDPLEAQLPDPSEVPVASMMEEFWQSLADRRTPDNNPFVPENNFLRYSSGLQSSNVVSPPPEMSPPAAPSLANRVQLVENISGLQSSPPLRDPPEEASETSSPTTVNDGLLRISLKRRSLDINSLRAARIQEAVHPTTLGSFFSQDRVRVGPGYRRQTSVTSIFVEITKEGNLAHHFDGILGLGFKDIAVGQATPVWYNMIKQGRLSQPRGTLGLTTLMYQLPKRVTGRLNRKVAFIIH